MLWMPLNLKLLEVIGFAREGLCDAGRKGTANEERSHVLATIRELRSAKRGSRVAEDAELELAVVVKLIPIENFSSALATLPFIETNGTLTVTIRSERKVRGLEIESVGDAEDE